MKISIVTPSLNQGKYLAEALESVRAQQYAQTEHLVMDGGSNDETLPLLRSLKGHKEWDYLCWRSEEDGGQSSALNKGFNEATGDIIGWLNSDDRYRAGCFDRVVRTFTENPDIDVLYGDFTLIDQLGAVQRIRREIEFNRFILLYHRVLYIPTPTTFFRRRVFDDGNRLKPGLHYAMDYEFFLRIAGLGYKIQHLPEVLADFRVHPESKSCSQSTVQAQEKQQIMWDVSPISRGIGSPLLRRAAFLGFQIAASLMRYSEKMLRGYYFEKKLWTGRERQSLPPNI
jgi:glycosyltransferase involved in cell wall biosynthesis